MAKPIGVYQLTEHALLEMRRRSIEEALVRRVLAAPEQRYAVQRVGMYCNRESY